MSLPIWYPPASRDGALEADLAAGGSLTDARCPACGYRGTFQGFTDNIRESGRCPDCGSWTRIRQLASVLCDVGGTLIGGEPMGSLQELGRTRLRIFNTEAHGTTHTLIGDAPLYVSSEYFGPETPSGQIQPDGRRHEDLQQLSFPSASFDLVISTDVFEHVPDPYQAHKEVSRVLVPGGHHVFTVPYDSTSPLDDVRARRGPSGEIHHFAEPIYHEDPMRPDDGALVFTIFGLEMIVNLARLGFMTTVYRPWNPNLGVVGDGYVFDSRKTAAPAASMQNRARG